VQGLVGPAVGYREIFIHDLRLADARGGGKEGFLVQKWELPVTRLRITFRHHKVGRAP